MSNQPLTAKDVSEMLLARTGDAMMDGDFGTFFDCFCLPYELETVDGARSLQTAEDMRATFTAVRAHLTKNRVTLMARHCVSADFRTADEVAATHETRLISKDILVQAPFPAFSVLRRQPSGAWKIASTSYMIADSDELNAALR